MSFFKRLFGKDSASRNSKIAVVDDPPKVKRAPLTPSVTCINRSHAWAGKKKPKGLRHLPVCDIDVTS